MVKNVFPILVVTALGAAESRAEPFNCNDFSDFRAQMTCYDLTSRGPEARNKPGDRAEQRPRTDKATRRGAPKRHRALIE